MHSMSFRLESQELFVKSQDACIGFGQVAECRSIQTSSLISALRPIGLSRKSKEHELAHRISLLHI